MKLVPNSLVFGLLFAIAFGSAFSESSARQTGTDVYFAGQIWPGNAAPIENGAMVVVDGVITAIGPRDEVSIPSVASRHDLGSQILIPGLVLPQTGLGGNQTEERTITPEIRAIDGFDFFADRDTLLESGITTVQVSPPRVRLMPGVGGVVKLSGKELTDRILQDEESLQIVLTAASRRPPRIYEPAVGPVSEDRPLTATRPQVATLPASMAALRQIFKAAVAGETDGDEILESVASLVESKKPIRIAASTAPEIRGAISLAKEFGIKIILTDCEGFEVFENDFADWKDAVAGVVLTADAPGSISNPTFEQIESRKEPWSFSRELIDAGIPVAIAPRQQTSLSSSMFVAGQFMRGGLNSQELLASLTYSSASMMGVSDRVGVLAEGKDADFVVLSGPPFAMHSRVRATYVGGEALFEREAAKSTTVVTAGKVYIGNGQYLNDGKVVVKGHSVRGVGTSVSAPADANIRHFKDAVIVPGFVDMGTGLGLGGPLTGNVNLATKLGDQLYPDDPAIEYARQNGITTALLSGSGTASPVVAFKLGHDARVIGDPVAIRFRLSGSTSSAIASAEKQLAAGKKYVDSWKKYEKDLAEYREKLKAEKAKPKTPEKKEEKKPDSKEPESRKADDKKKPEKKEGEEKDKPKPKPEEKKDPEKKDKDEKESEKDKEKKKKPLPDPITGTWEGEIDVERIPPQFRVFTIEMELAEDGTVTGSVAMMRQEAEISSGSFNRETRKLTITMERRGQEVEISGELDADGNFEGTMELGRMGEVKVTAKRTVDKSKKPEPEPEEKDKPEKKDPDKDKDEEEKKEKPSEGDKDKEKPADKKEEDEKKSDSKDADKKDEKPEEKKEEAKKPALKEPKKPKVVEALEPYKALFAKQIPAFVETRELFTIKEAAKLFTAKYDVRTVIVGADELAREPEALAEHKVSVIAGPKFSIPVAKQPEPTNLPQLLANEQLPFAFQSSGTTGSGQLAGAVQYSVSQGLSSIDALHGLTSAPAKILSNDSKFGSIASGSDADLVVLSGPPFEFSTKILAVMIDGVWVY